MASGMQDAITWKWKWKRTRIHLQVKVVSPRSEEPPSSTNSGLKEVLMHEIKTILEQHLEKMGLSQNMIPGFLKSISNFFNDHPEMNLSKINEKLQYIGWDGIKMDYHTLELAKAWYEICPDTSGPHKIKSFNTPEWQGNIL